MTEDSSKMSYGQTGANGFILFLILILLLMGNSNTFNNYFELLDEQTSRINQLLKAFSVTANGLKGAFTAPQEIFKQV